MLTDIVDSHSLMSSKSEQPKLLGEWTQLGLSNAWNLCLRRSLRGRLPTAGVFHWERVHTCVSLLICRMLSAYRCSSPGGDAPGRCSEQCGVGCSPAWLWHQLWRYKSFECFWLSFYEDLLITLLRLKCCFSKRAAKGMIRFPSYAMPCSSFPGLQSDSFIPLLVVFIFKFDEAWRKATWWFCLWWLYCCE